MKILITGGTGLVGSELGKALVARGHQLVVVSRDPEASELYTPYPHQALSWKELENNAAKILGDIEVIYNLAGAGIADKSWSAAYKKILVDSRVETTNKLVSLCESHAPQLKTFISTSAIGIYGNQGDTWLSEDSPQDKGFLGDLCSQWESSALKMKNARKVIFRVGVVLSEKGGALQKMLPILQSGMGGSLGSGQQYMSWIDIDDLVSAFVYALEHSMEGVFNAVAPNPETNKDFTKKLAKRLSKASALPAPSLALKIVLGEMSQIVLASQRVLCEKLIQSGFTFQYENLETSLEKRVPILGSSERQLIFEQWVPHKPEEIFPFFAEAKNLEKITPPLLKFRILNSSTEKIQEGTEINYKLKINGIPIHWKTKITHWDPPHAFIDNQEKGPYKKWNHLHQFEELGSGTLMTDRIRLVIPMGLLGLGATGWKVFSDVEEIFKYRRNYIYQNFCKKPGVI